MKFLKFLKWFFAIIVLIVAAVIVLAIVLPSDVDDDRQSEVVDIDMERETVLSDDETVKVTYRGIDNAVGLENAYYLYLTVENKTDLTVMILLENVSVNGEMVTPLSAVPMTITAGSKSSNPFILPCQNTTSVTGIGSIETIRFTARTYKYDGMELISETEELTVEP